MATTGWTFKGKFYPYGSELPKELKDTLKERGLDEMGQPLKAKEPASGQDPVGELVNTESEPAEGELVKTKRRKTT